MIGFHGWGSILVLSLFTQLAWASPSQNVRVRIYKNLSRITVSGLGVRAGTDKELRLVEDKNWQVHSPDQPMVIEGEHLKINGKHAPNRVHYYKGDVVAEMELEQYLKGVVASEMPASWPLEALKAQAVASRSYAMSVINSRKDKFFHLEATVMNQVFDYPHYRGLLKVYKDKIERVIEETKGEYLVWDSTKRLHKAFYHAHCGGGTEEADNVWGHLKKRGVVKDSGCAIDRRGNWQIKLNEDELKDRLLPELKHRDDLQITNIEKDGLSEFGRALRMKISLGERQVVFPSNEFRSRIGFSQLKSTRFEIEKRGAYYTFTGKGYGHGAGLCQNGSRLMAMGGAPYTDILGKYYPRARISEANGLH